MPLRAIARLIQTMLYAQRFFPYYVYNILGGIEDDGTFIHSFVPSLLSLFFHTGLSALLVLPTNLGVVVLKLASIVYSLQSHEMEHR